VHSQKFPFQTNSAQATTAAVAMEIVANHLDYALANQNIMDRVVSVSHFIFPLIIKSTC